MAKHYIYNNIYNSLNENSSSSMNNNINKYDDIHFDVLNVTILKLRNQNVLLFD